MSNAAAPPSRKIPTAQIVVVILLSFVAIIPFTVHLQPFTYEYSPYATTTNKPHQLLKPTVGNSSSRKIKSEIESLEHDLESLEKEFTELSNEFRQVTSNNNNKNNPQSATTNNVKPKKKRNKKKTQQDIDEEFPNTNTEKQPDRFANFKEREPKKWWVRKDLFGDASQQTATLRRRNLLIVDDEEQEEEQDEDNGAIIPFDLSVNHLQLVDRAPGSPYTDLMVNEEFLPVVLPSDITFRWRSRARPNSLAEDGVKTTAYQIIAR